jgi:L-threonylcarbamoyladenylate synthase
MIVLKISSKNFNKIIKEAIKSIKKGKIMVCPTDTIYGLVADARNEKTVKKIFKMKKRKKQKPLPIFVKDVKMAKRLALINKEQELFLRNIWPGEITVILKKKKSYKIPKIIFDRKKTIGLRIPKYNLIGVLLKELNRPLTGTSANISGKPGSNKIKDILNQFKEQKIKPDLIIDAGNLKKSKPSTIIDLTGSKPKFLRIGQLSKKVLLKNYGRFYLREN